LPELEVEFEDTLPLALMQVDSERGLVYGMVLRCLSPRRLSFTGFGSYDYLNQKIDDTWTINPDSNGKSSYVASYHVNAARRRLYAVARTSEGFRLICHDLDQKTNVFEFPLDWGKEPRLTPDGLELWLPNHSDESISVHDAEDGTLLAVIDLSDYGGTGRSPVAPTHIRFVPDGSKAYVTSSYAPAPLLVIDTKERSVKKAFFADGRRYPTSLDIGPAPRRDAPPQTMLMGSDATVGEF
jgi:DNA-binding beta-propeller fold protein YncE